MTILTTGRPSIGQKAALLIFEEGPMTQADLFTRLDFGVRPDTRRAALQRAIASGWLEARDGDKIDITQDALELLEAQVRYSLHLDGSIERTMKKAEKGGMATGPAFNMMQRKPYVPPKRVPRDDEPSWSQRPAGFRMLTIA